MKNKFLKGSVIFTILSVAFLGCKKENPAIENSESESNIGISEQKFTKQVSAQNGTLVFENEAHMMSELDRLSKLSFEEKLAFENNLGFRSLATIDKLINDAEVTHQEEFFKGVDPNLSVKEYENMGLFYKHTSIFNEYLDKGVIERFVSPKDKSVSFALMVNAPGFINILNEEGDVIVGDNVYKFRSTFLDIICIKTNELIKQINFSPLEKATSNWSKSSAWNYDGSTKRYSYSVYGTCITSSNQTPGGLIDAVFYVNAVGEEKKFGSWAKRSSYLPVYSFTGNWTANYTAKESTYWTIITNPFVLNDNDYSSPYSWHSANDPYGQTNNFLRYLKPNGSWQLPDPWLVCSPFNVNYSMKFTFSCGASGYEHYLNK